MAYSPLTWVEKSTKVGPTNMNHLELGLQAAAAVADAALPTPAGSNGQFLKKVAGVWVPTSFAASDIPSYPSRRHAGAQGRRHLEQAAGIRRYAYIGVHECGHTRRHCGGHGNLCRWPHQTVTFDGFDNGRCRRTSEFIGAPSRAAELCCVVVNTDEFFDRLYGHRWVDGRRNMAQPILLPSPPSTAWRRTSRATTCRRARRGTSSTTSPRSSAPRRRSAAAGDSSARRSPRSTRRPRTSRPSSTRRSMRASSSSPSTTTAS
jgi:hypothetical protein